MAQLKNSLLIFVGLMCASHALIGQSACEVLAEQIAEFSIEYYNACQHKKVNFKRLAEQQGLTAQEIHQEIEQIEQQQEALHQLFKARHLELFRLSNDAKKLGCHDIVQAALAKRVELGQLPKSILG